MTSNSIQGTTTIQNTSILLYTIYVSKFLIIFDHYFIDKTRLQNYSFRLWIWDQLGLRVAPMIIISFILKQKRIKQKKETAREFWISLLKDAIAPNIYYKYNYNPNNNNKKSHATGKFMA